MPFILNPTNWGDLGYPILDQPVSFPYTSEDEEDEFLQILDQYWEGPEGLNKGDVLRLILTSEILNVNGEWVSAGVQVRDGRYLKTKKAYADFCNGGREPNTVYSSVTEADQHVMELVTESGDPRQVVSQLRVITCYLDILAHLRRSLCEEGTKTEKLLF